MAYKVTSKNKESWGMGILQLQSILFPDLEELVYLIYLICFIRVNHLQSALSLSKLETVLDVFQRISVNFLKMIPVQPHGFPELSIVT